MREIPHKYSCTEAVNSLGGNGDILELRAAEEKCYRPQTNEDARRSPDLCRRAEEREREKKERKRENHPNSARTNVFFFFFRSLRERDAKTVQGKNAAIFFFTCVRNINQTVTFFTLQAHRSTISILYKLTAIWFMTTIKNNLGKPPPPSTHTLTPRFHRPHVKAWLINQ